MMKCVMHFVNLNIFPHSLNLQKTHTHLSMNVSMNTHTIYNLYTHCELYVNIRETLDAAEV